eukprot:TRINITY_DN3018_c0_g1_i10.p2 TRINITY_DN3018_c0_g1~~TRINITY_DN3018_c0_g1_i10.p2  ORF type:complete len:249 (+),score=77.29 TRINITY_DN3018_c0_g1_i10:142-888(+)
MEAKSSVFFEFHEGLPRQGPGSFECTSRAFSMLKDLPKDPDILDIGCGTGAQTFDLAKLSSGKILAVDKHIPFINSFKQSIKEKGLESRITAVVGDMGNLKLDKRFDLIWSEGAAYIIGFGKALNLWKPLLKERGYLVISECTWFKKDAAGEVKEFWDKMDSGLKHYEEWYPVIEESGYELVGEFKVPSEVWWTSYYNAHYPREKEIREKYKDNAEVNKEMKEIMYEVDIFKKYSDYYGYNFFVMRLK